MHSLVCTFVARNQEKSGSLVSMPIWCWSPGFLASAWLCACKCIVNLPGHLVQTVTGWCIWTAIEGLWVWTDLAICTYWHRDDSLPTADSSRAVTVPYKSMHRLVLVNCQEKHAKDNCNMYELYDNWPSWCGPGRIAQLVTCLATDASLTADPGVASSIPALSYIFVETGNEIISTVNLLPSAESFKKGCCQLQAKVCARSTS